MQCAVFFFSRAGGNYVSGHIVNLKVGNTQQTAEKIAALLQAPLAEIKAKETYPQDYHECTRLAEAELKQEARPELSQDPDPAPFDTVILCYPCWWGTFPRPVASFLEKHDFAGKTIIPVCTHEGSGMGQSERELKKLLPKAKIRQGLPLYGSRCQDGRADADIERFFRRHPALQS